MDYLSKNFDLNSTSQVALLDELSLWSSHFGQVLLEHIPMRKRMTVLDVGFGLGFPLLEIAQRLGKDAQVYGIDPWETALKIAESKAQRLQLPNVHLTLGDAVQMPFEDKFFDLVVSNVGVNNFADAPRVIDECYRVLKKPGRICLTSNLQGTFAEFYSAFRLVIKELDEKNLVNKIDQQEQHRSTVESIRDLLEEAGFSVLKVLRSKFSYRFSDGTAMFNHLLIYSDFLLAWRKIIPKEKEKFIFASLEKKLNEQAEWEGELKLTVPMVYVEAVK